MSLRKNALWYIAFLGFALFHRAPSMGTIEVQDGYLVVCLALLFNAFLACYSDIPWTWEVTLYGIVGAEALVYSWLPFPESMQGFITLQTILLIINWFRSPDLPQVYRKRGTS